MDNICKHIHIYIILHVICEKHRKTFTRHFQFYFSSPTHLSIYIYKRITETRECICNICESSDDRFATFFGRYREATSRCNARKIPANKSKIRNVIHSHCERKANECKLACRKTQIEKDTSLDLGVNSLRSSRRHSPCYLHIRRVRG